MASVKGGLEVVEKSSTPVSGNSAEFFDKAPTHFSTIMASVVDLEVVDRIYGRKFTTFKPTTIAIYGYRVRFEGRN